MLIYGKNPYLYTCMATPPPDDGALGADGGGSAPPPPPLETPPTDAKFSDKDMAALRRKHEREMKKRDKEFENLKAQLEELKTPPPPVEPEPDQKDLAGRLELMEKKHVRQIDDLQIQLSTAETKAAEERENRRRIERDRLLDKALEMAECTNKNRHIAVDHFRTKIAWDEVDEKWMYRTKNGNLVDIMDGIQEEIPDIFKEPRTNRGGAGTQSGMPPNKARLAQQLEHEEQKLKEIYAKGGRMRSNVQKFQQQKRKVNELKEQLASMK
jgi:hypothetical protein